MTSQNRAAPLATNLCCPVGLSFPGWILMNVFLTPVSPKMLFKGNEKCRVTHGIHLSSHPSIFHIFFRSVSLDRQARLLSHLPLATADSQMFLLTLGFDLLPAIRLNMGILRNTKEIYDYCKLEAKIETEEIISSSKLPGMSSLAFSSL